MGLVRFPACAEQVVGKVEGVLVGHERIVGVRRLGRRFEERTAAARVTRGSLNGIAGRAA